MSSLQIRPATPDDVPLILNLIRELAAFEREPYSVKATEADLLRDGFGDAPRFHCLIAEADQLPSAFAVFHYNCSTWEGNAGIHLEDLYVRESSRGKGVGKALLREIARIALGEGCTRLNWNVLKWNQPAIDFYRSLGATILDDWSLCRLTHDSMSQFAEHHVAS